MLTPTRAVRGQWLRDIHDLFDHVDHAADLQYMIDFVGLY
jgi:hypothetical protein